MLKIFCFLFSLCCCLVYAQEYPRVRLNTSITVSKFPYGPKAYEAPKNIRMETITPKSNVRYVQTHIVDSSDLSDEEKKEFLISDGQGNLKNVEIDVPGLYHVIEYEEEGKWHRGYIYETNVKGTPTIPQWEKLQSQIAYGLEIVDDSKFREKSEVECETSKYSKTLNEVISNIANFGSDKEFKNTDYLNEYFRLFRKRSPDGSCSEVGADDNYHEKYLEEYESLFDQAATKFDIPSAFLKCKAFKETQFNKDLVSSSGAVGLMQFLGNGVEQINEILEINVTPNQVNNLKRKLKESKKGSRDFLEAGIVLKKIELKQKWIEYLKENNYKGDPLKYKFTAEAAAKSGWEGIGAGGMYLSFIESVVSLRIANNPKLSRRGPLFYSIIGGAYNAGPNATTAKLRELNSTQKLKQENWYQILTDSKSRISLENERHIRSLRACMEAGNFDGPLITKPIKLRRGEDYPNSTAELRELRNFSSYTDNTVLRIYNQRSSGTVKVTFADIPCD